MENGSGPRQFATTQWSLVIAARSDENSRSQARRALEQLCRTYWYPLYAFVRGRGCSAEAAQDLTQAFFARILETGGFDSADRERGRFRSYLLGAMKHFLANEWHRGRTKKRGGELHFIEWDALAPESRYAEAPVHTDGPEQRFDREWALETVAHALQALREEKAVAGKLEQFEAFEPFLTGDGDQQSYRQIGSRLEMSEGSVRVAVHRLRRSFGAQLREEIADTVIDQADLDREVRYLLDVLQEAGGSGG